MPQFEMPQVSAQDENHKPEISDADPGLQEIVPDNDPHKREKQDNVIGSIENVDDFLDKMEESDNIPERPN